MAALARIASVFGLCLALVPLPSLAQQSNTETTAAQLPFNVAPQNALLILDTDRFYDESAFGQRIAAELEAERQALLDEKTEVEKALEAEESRLVALRETTPADEFAVMADEFDARVQEARSAQTLKSRRLARQQDIARQTFFQQALPILAAIVRDSGALVILERSTVFLAADNIDITDAAIEAVNAAFGDGTAQ